MMLRYNNPTYVVNGSGLADILGPWVDCLDAHHVVAQADWSAFASTAGTIRFQGSSDYTRGVTPNPSAASIVNLTSWGEFGTQPAAGAAGSLVITFEYPTALIRAVYQRSAGGTTSQFQMRLLTRGA